MDEYAGPDVLINYSFIPTLVHKLALIIEGESPKRVKHPLDTFIN